jgi:thioredoxin reductase
MKETIMTTNTLPVAVIGAGPVGLAAAAHLLSRGEVPLVLEAGDTVGASIRAWGHVRLFSPWRYVVDPVSADMLEASGWTAPPAEELPTGNDLVDRYLLPLAQLPALAPHIHLGMRVASISRQGVDKMKTPGRDDAPFVLRVRDRGGRTHALRARAVIDASGTWTAPNPLGADGVTAVGEADAAGRIRYGIPDVRGAERQRYAGRRVLVAGSGHSAFNALLDLADLATEAPGTTITWVIRGAMDRDLYGGGDTDALPARGRLGQRLRRLVEAGTIRLVSGFRIEALRQTDDGIEVLAEDGHIGPVDEIIAATGFRPDLSLTRELRLSLDPAVESPVALAPLIDPNVHSCGTVPPHGFRELSHPEQGFYTVGMKSYGRAPTFLLLTGYEQVRSVVAALAGDLEAAADVRLTLPQTGVCSGPAATDGDDGGEAPRPLIEALPSIDLSPVAGAAGCCGGPAPAASGACCALDAEAKAAGKSGCGCAEEQQGPELTAATSATCC